MPSPSLFLMEVPMLSNLDSAPASEMDNVLTHTASLGLPTTPRELNSAVNPMTTIDRPPSTLLLLRPNAILGSPGSAGW